MACARACKHAKRSPSAVDHHRSVRAAAATPVPSLGLPSELKACCRVLSDPKSARSSDPIACRRIAVGPLVRPAKKTEKTLKGAVDATTCGDVTPEACALLHGPPKGCPARSALAGLQRRTRRGDRPTLFFTENNCYSHLGGPGEPRGATRDPQGRPPRRPDGPDDDGRARRHFPGWVKG